MAKKKQPTIFDSAEIDEKVIQERSQQHIIKEEINCQVEVLEEDAKGRPTKLKGVFIETDVFNASTPRRMYPKAVVEAAIAQFNQQDRRLGADGHIENAQYKDMIFLHDEFTVADDGKGHFSAEIIPETEGGRVVQFMAKKKIPITVSLFGLGSEKFDKDATDKNGEVGGFVVQPGYMIERLDGVISPSFTSAKAMMESLQKKEKGDMDELKKQIEEQNEKISALEKRLKEKDTSNPIPEETLKLLESLKADKEKAEAKLEAKKKAKELLEGDTLKDHTFKESIAKHLDNCDTAKEVEAMLPRVLDIFDEKLKGAEKHPPVSVVIPEGSLFGDKNPETTVEAMSYLLDGLKDTGYPGPDNPKWVGERLIKNYVKLQMTGAHPNAFDGNDPDSMVFAESRKNPLWVVTAKAKRLREAVGDTEAYTSDVSSTGAFILPLYKFIIQDITTIIQSIAAVQPLDRPTGTAFFLKEYYGDMAGTYTNIDGNFNRASGNIAEAGTAKQLKTAITSTAITLDTAKKFQFPWTIELEQDLMAYWGIGLDSLAVQTCRRETFRELVADFIYAIINGTAFANGDGLVQNAGSPVNWSETKDEGWTYGEWIEMGFGKVLKTTSALLDKDPWNTDFDTILADSQKKYLFSDKRLISDKIKQPSGVGIKVNGQYSEEWKLLTSGSTQLTGKVVMVHRGQSFVDAAMVWLPYILFWIGPRIDLQAAKAVRETMHRGKIAKACGAKVAIININA